MIFDRKAPQPQPRPAENAARSLPFQLPPQLQVQLDRSRRISYVLGGALAVVFVLSVATVVFLRNGAPGAAADAAKDAKSDRPATGLKPGPEIRDVLPPKRLGLAPTPPGPDAKPSEPFLETIGGLAAVHLYQSYLNIGLLADAVEHDTYSRTEAIGILLTISELVNLVEKQLGKLTAGALSADDREALANVHSLTTLLRTQCNGLLAYWGTAEEVHATRYHAAREKSWVTLKEMLGLDD